MNRAYHKGRKHPPESAKLAWIRHKSRKLTAPLAAHLGLSKAAVSKWRQVPEDRLDAVAEYLGVPRESLRPDLAGIHAVTPMADLYEQSKGTL